MLSPGHIFTFVFCNVCEEGDAAKKSFPKVFTLCFNDFSLAFALFDHETGG